jgi:hypothetical protein
MTLSEPVNCPLPGCGQQLHLVREGSRALYADDLTDVPGWSDNYTTTWRVECEDGHVVAVPGPSRCSCTEDPCRHDKGEDQDAFDWGDDYRTFKPHDAARLRDLIAALGVAS